MNSLQWVQEAKSLAKNLYLYLAKIEGMIEGSQEQNKINQKKWTLIGFDNITTLPNLDNSIKVSIANSPLKNQKENYETMQRIQKMKNVYQRVDGRYEWRKMINGVKHQIIERDLETLSKRIKAYKNSLKNGIKPQEKKQPETLYQTATRFYEQIILGQVKTKMIKSVSAKHYYQALLHFSQLKKNIGQYGKDEIINFLNGIEHHRTGAYCYFLLKRVFADEFEKGNLKRNPIATLKNPFSQARHGQKGTWLNLEQQRLLKANLDDSIFSKEILFYLMTGCRLNEAYDAKIDFEKQVVTVHRQKTEFSGVKETVIPLSSKFCELIKDDWPKMFVHSSYAFRKQLINLFKKLGIKNKSTHDLRHTFSSNLYYLGTDPKRQQYLMGHASIKLTYDIYTTLDMSVKKQDIIDIWGDLYPEF